MYQQVLVDSIQTSLQYIFWWVSQNELIKTIELLTLTYFIRTVSVNQCLTKVNGGCRSKSKSVIDSIARLLDDLITGSKIYQKKLHQSKRKDYHIIAKRKIWAGGNDHPIFSVFRTSTSRSNKENLSYPSIRIPRNQCYAWDCQTITYLSVNHLPSFALIKWSFMRIFLIFDPLGLLNPVTLFDLAGSLATQFNRNELIPLELNTKWKRFETE